MKTVLTSETTVAAGGGVGLILGDRQAQGACWDIILLHFLEYSRRLVRLFPCR
jgi:hypothetical protein